MPGMKGKTQGKMNYGRPGMKKKGKKKVAAKSKTKKYKR